MNNSVNVQEERTGVNSIEKRFTTIETQVKMLALTIETILNPQPLTTDEKEDTIT